MVIFSDAEFEILKKYKNIRIIEEKDRNLVERLQQQGMLNCSFDIKDGKGYEAARMKHPFQRRQLAREIISRNPFYKAVYDTVTTLYH